jgi:hypothetical protein
MHISSLQEWYMTTTWKIYFKLLSNNIKLFKNRFKFLFSSFSFGLLWKISLSMRCNKSVRREIEIHRETIYIFFPSFLAMQYEVVQKIKKIWNFLFMFSKAKSYILIHLVCQCVCLNLSILTR